MPSPRPKLQSQPRPGTSREPIRWHAAAEREPLCTLYAKGGEALDDKAKAELLRAARLGEPVELQLEAVAFVQRETPNRNYVRFKPGMLAAFAKSFEGQPMLRDHMSWQLTARGGTIVSSKLEHMPDGTKQIRMRLNLVKPWAVESALDGTLDRFSIGWSRTGPVMCSLCGESLAKCDHWPGDRGTDGKVCEAVFTAADGTEVSGVNVPAVIGTRIESISQLDAIDPSLLADILAENTTPGEPKQMKTLLAAIVTSLSLPEASTDDDALRAVEALADELKIEKAKASAHGERLATLEADSTARARADRLMIVDGGIARLLAAGKIKPGSETEAALRRQGGLTKKTDGSIDIDMKRDVGVFEASVKDLLDHGVTMTPVGAPLPATKPDPSPAAPTEAKAMVAANPTLAGMLKAAGITDEQFEKHGANGREMLAAMQR